MQDFEARNYRIDNVELNWAKLSKPVNPFGTEQWELQIATTDKAIADTWSSNHLNVKQDKVDSTKFTVSLKRKAVKANGDANSAVRVVDSSAVALPHDKIAQIGNGSIGNVIVYQYPYSTAGREGIANSLTAVQVTDFKEYAAPVDFEPIVNESSDTSNSSEMPF
tara:strand:- start:136 stop:630 length:495 start_codon:yes stop_codon:yes gene_type:complete